MCLFVCVFVCLFLFVFFLFFFFSPPQASGRTSESILNAIREQQDRVAQCEDTIKPVRGQLTHLLPQTDITYSYVAPTSNGVLYMFPRKTGIVLGGTTDYGEWGRDPNPDEIRRMVEGHGELATLVKCHQE